VTGVWTHGTWTVKAGREDEFVEAWRAMAREVAAHLEVRTTPVLLRDRDAPNVFISFGPWENVDAVTRFRASEPFRRHVTAMGGLLEDFQARTLDQVVGRG
jgi:heme-degrading monooxygenase HmoA